MKGLEDQLLGEVVRKERPDLEEAKDRLVVSISNDKKQLKVGEGGGGRRGTGGCKWDKAEGGRANGQAGLDMGLKTRYAASQ